MKALKKMALLLLAMMTMTMGLVVQEGSAATEKKEMPPAPTEGIPSRDLSSGENSTLRIIDIQAKDYLMLSESSIEKIGSNKIAVSGKTQAYSSVSSIGVDLYLQRWDASRQAWVDIGKVGEYTNLNSSVVYGGKVVTVPRGYYYRTRGYHWLSAGGYVEDDRTYTPYIYLE